MTSPKMTNRTPYRRCVDIKRLMYALVWFLVIVVIANASDKEQTCEAGDNECAATADANEDDSCVDKHEQCGFWASKDECVSNSNYMNENCPKSCGVCQKKKLTESAWGVPQDSSDSRVEAVLKTTEDYMTNQVMVEEKYKNIRSNCQNRHELCAFWAVVGECEINPQYMALHCAPSCQSCELLDFQTRCPYDKDAPTALTNEGELNTIFERIMTLPHYQQFGPKALSKPNGKDEGVIEGPWVVTLEHFLSSQECKELIELGALEGYERSSDVGEAKFDGTYDSFENEGRTSTNAWCVEKCYENATVQTVLARMENLTGIPKENYEYLQMLQYEETQRYQTHHDYIEHQLERSEGPRILTLFLYLNTVPEGGGTNFPRLGNTKDGLTVDAVEGKAVLWPSVLDKDPNRKDGRTTHQALPVIRGRKWGANAWIHQRDFQDPFNRSCH